MDAGGSGGNPTTKQVARGEVIATQNYQLLNRNNYLGEVVIGLS